MWSVSASQQIRVDRRSLMRFFGSSSGSELFSRRLPPAATIATVELTGSQTLRPSFRVRRPGSRSSERSAVAAPLREAERQGRPYRQPVSGFVFGFGVSANHRLLYDAPWIVGKRGTVAVNFGVHPDLDELRLLPVIHFFTPRFVEKFLHHATDIRQLVAIKQRAQPSEGI